MLSRWHDNFGLDRFSTIFVFSAQIADFCDMFLLVSQVPAGRKFGGARDTKYLGGGCKLAANVTGKKTCTDLIIANWVFETNVLKDSSKISTVRS